MIGGLVYVGRSSSADRYSADPALIDPSLKIDWRRPDVVGQTMGYWPSYSEISPQSRAAYLGWLIDGRSDPRAYIGHVFLYFYGLERRVLADLGLATGHPELAIITAEVRRLHQIYGYNGSFHGYSTSFLELLEAQDALTADLMLPDTDSLGDVWEVPLIVRVALGRYVAAGAPIPPEWALVWLRTDPATYFRTPAERCRPEFEDLFHLRYQVQYASGMVLQMGKSRIRLSYRAASAGLTGNYDAAVGDLPDVTRSDAPIGKLRELASECTDALDSYSRYLGRHPDSRGKAAAVGLLPEELIARHGGHLVTDLRAWIEGLLGEGPTATVSIGDVVERWSPGRTEKLTKQDAVGIAGLLGRLGAGMEPDVRFGGVTPKPDVSVVLFPLGPGAPATPSSNYAAAALLVRLAAVLAAADGTITDDERQHLATHLEVVLELDNSERTRLEAVLTWLATQKADLSGLKRRLQDLGTEQRVEIGHFLVDVAAADGRITPDEITMLTKLYRLLGLEDGDVYRRVHALESGDPGPVSVRPADVDGDRWSIPPEPSQPMPGMHTVRLDEAKIAARRAETATVSALLSDIFVDDAELARPVVVRAPVASASLAGLDAPHTALVGLLRAQLSWDRAEVEDVAAGQGLAMLDGAIDRINEALIEACGEPLIEGDDPLEINDYALQSLT